MRARLRRRSALAGRFHDEGCGGRSPVLAESSSGGATLERSSAGIVTIWVSAAAILAGGKQQAGTTLFSPFGADTDDFPEERQWMINLRVDGLETLLGKLRDGGIEVITKPEWINRGSFARIHDPKGNPIELWEPPAS